MDLAPETLWGAGIVILLIALIWGTMKYRRRNRALDPVRDEATRQNYRAADEKQQARERKGEI